MIGGMVETRIAMGFVIPGAFVVEVCKHFSYIVIRMLQPTNWKKYHFVWHLYMFSAAILFLRFMDAFLLVWSHPFYCPKIVYGGYEGSLTLLKAVGSGCLQSWLLLLKQKTTVVGPVIVSDSQRFSNALLSACCVIDLFFLGSASWPKPFCIVIFHLRKLFMPWLGYVYRAWEVL